MSSKRKRPTRLTAEQRENRATALRVLLASPDLLRLNDNACSVELNRRRIPTIDGSRLWQAVQVRRLRARPLPPEAPPEALSAGDKRRQRLERSFRALRGNIERHFGSDRDGLDNDLISYAAWIATIVQHHSHFIGYQLRRDEPLAISADTYRSYKRHCAILARLIEVLTIASDTFERGSLKSGPTLTLEEAAEILRDLEPRIALRAAGSAPISADTVAPTNSASAS